MAKYTRAEDADHDPDVEAVDICLPTHLHERIAVEGPALRQTRARGKAHGPRWRRRRSDDRSSRASRPCTLMAAQVVRFIPPYRDGRGYSKFRTPRPGPLRNLSSALRGSGLERMAGRSRAKRRRSLRSADPRYRFLPAPLRQARGCNGIGIRRSSSRRGLDSGAILVSIHRRRGRLRRLAPSGGLSVLDGVHHTVRWRHLGVRPPPARRSRSMAAMDACIR